MSGVEDIDRIPHPDDLLVSVCMITYRHEAFIAEAIEGVLAQELEGGLELVVSDDRSPDGTLAVCKAFQQRHPERIRLLIPRENLGMARNLEQALGRCRGKYVAFCEGDDVWTDPQKLAKQIAVMERDPSCTGSYHATRMIMEDGEPTGRLFREDLPEEITVVGTMAELSPFHTSSFLFRATPLMHALPTWIRHVASLDMALFTLFVGDGAYHRVPGVMSSYRKHPGGITTTEVNLGARFQQKRIQLWLYVDRHFGYRYTERCKALFRHHWGKLVQLATPRARMRFLAELVGAVPGWFLRKPRFFIQRFREVLKR